MPGPARAADLLPVGLRDLAASATHRETWPRLRSYAQSQTDPEWSGWAYFLAGYQEYEGQHYSEAAQDLAQAAQSGFSLADYAVLLSSLGAQPVRPAAGCRHGASGISPSRFPRSHLRNQALALRASALLDAQQAQQAIDALLAEPETRQQPALALLLGAGLVAGPSPGGSCHRIPGCVLQLPGLRSGQSCRRRASGAARTIGRRLSGPGRRTRDGARGGALQGGRYDDALKEYSELLRDEPASPMVPRWQLGQARCLVRLHRSPDALQALFTHFASPDLEAQRLALLVQVHAQQTDALGITQDLAQLETSYANSPAYADALSAAGMFYYRQLNWQEAARDYRRLYELFPQSDHLREDGWRLAWCDYLLGDPKTSDVISDYLMQFPDSPRAPAALYWLGRIEEEQGALAEARALYALLVKRFVHSYYAPQAAARLAAIAREAGKPCGPERFPRRSPGRRADPGAGAAGDSARTRVPCYRSQ